MQIDFNIENQRLNKLKESFIVENSQNYLECSFIFSDDWQSFKKLAYFQSTLDSVPKIVEIVDDKCIVPHESIKAPFLKVWVIGYKDEVKITTNFETLSIIRSGVDVGDETIEKPSKELWETLFNDFEFTYDKKEGNLKIAMIDVTGTRKEKNVIIFSDTDKYIVSVVYEETNKQFKFTFNDGDFITCPFKVDLGNYYTKTETNTLLGNYYTKAETDLKFLSKEEAQNTYATISSVNELSNIINSNRGIIDSIQSEINVMQESLVNVKSSADEAKNKAQEAYNLALEIDGSPKDVYDDLSALQTAFPSGASGVYLTSDNGHWHYWNGTAWTDGGVYQSSEDIEQIKSGLDRLEDDLGLLFKGTATHQQVLFTIDDVEVGGLLKYKFSAMSNYIGYIGLYKADGTLISPVGKTSINSGVLDYEGSLTIPTDFSYCSCYTSSNKTIDVDYITYRYITDRTAELESTIEEIFVDSKNIANANIVNGRVNIDTGYSYIPSPIAGYALTDDFIEVESNSTYIISFSRVFPHETNNDKRPKFTITILQFDDSKNYLGKDTIMILSNTDYNGGYTFTVGDNTKSIKIQFYNSSYTFDEMVFEDFQIEKGYKGTSYVEAKSIDNDMIDANMIYGKLVEDGTLIRNYDVPKYYFDDNYMPNKVKRINQLGESCYSNGDAFIFITDEHWDSNQKKSPSLINYIYDRCHIEKLFNGGDTYSVGISDDCVQSIRRAFGGKIYSTAGNHEYFSGTTFSKVGYVFDTDDNEIVWGNAEKRYYYVDNKRAKIRYIFPTEFYQGADNAIQGWETDNDQVSWIANVAMNVEKGWGMVFITHSVYLIGYNDSRNVERNSNAYNLVNLIDSYSGDGEVIAIFQGHVHMDRITSTPNGIPIIMTTCDKNIHTPLTVGSWSGDDMIDERPSGTIKEQAFDVVFINRDTRTINCLRIGCPARNGVDDNIGSYVDERVVNY